MQVTTNDTQRLFVINSGSGYTCFGFENCYRESIQLAIRLNRPDLSPSPDEIGQIKQYENYQALLGFARNRDLGTWFSLGTPIEVQRILESARLNDSRLRLFYGDNVTGRDWLEENDMYGKIGRSGGTLKVPLLLAGRDGYGSAILTDSVVKIVSFPKGKPPVVLYQHSNYHMPELTIVENEHPDYPATVLSNGTVHARFKKLQKAQDWISFMEGLSRKP